MRFSSVVHERSKARLESLLALVVRERLGLTGPVGALDGGRDALLLHGNRVGANLLVHLRTHRHKLLGLLS